MKIKIGYLILLVAGLLSGSANAQEKVKTADLKVKSSVVCGMCKERVENGLVFEKGVKEVVVDLETKEVTVTYNPLKNSPEKLRTAISKLGYDADTVKADPKAYEKLPACCKKDAAPH